MTRAHEAWCVADDHANYIDGDCGCWCHGQVHGQESLIPDPRTTTEVRPMTDREDPRLYDWRNATIGDAEPDKTDPRLEILAGIYNDSVPRWPCRPEHMVNAAADLDAADHAAGIVRVDTRDEALVERLWDAVDDVVTGEIETGTVSRQALVDAVLAALREES